MSFKRNFSHSAVVPSRITTAAAMLRVGFGKPFAGGIHTVGTLQIRKSPKAMEPPEGFFSCDGSADISLKIFIISNKVSFGEKRGFG